MTGIIYLHRITDVRAGGVSRRTFSLLRELCGKDSLSNVLIATTMWTDPPTKIELRREAQLRDDPKFFRPALDDGAQLTRRSHKTAGSAHDIIRLLLDKDPVVMKLQKELVDDERDLRDTAAGEVLNAEVKAIEERYKREMVEVEKRLLVALEEKDLKALKELQEYQEQEDRKAQLLVEKMESLQHGYAEERVFWERRANEAEEERKAAEEKAKQLNGQLDELRQQFFAATGQYKDDLLKRIKDLEEQLKKLRGGGCIIA